MTQYMVYWCGANGGPMASSFDNLTTALEFTHDLRNDPDSRFITMASELAGNVGKLGVDSIVDGKCPDGTDFLGRTSRYGVLLKRGQ